MKEAPLYVWKIKASLMGSVGKVHEVKMSVVAANVRDAKLAVWKATKENGADEEWGKSMIGLGVFGGYLPHTSSV